MGYSVGQEGNKTGARQSGELGEGRLGSPRGASAKLRARPCSRGGLAASPPRGERGGPGEAGPPRWRRAGKGEGLHKKVIVHVDILPPLR